MWTIGPFLLHRFIASSASSLQALLEKYHSLLHRFKRFIRFYRLMLLKGWFRTVGYVKRARHDNGPEFRDKFVA